MNTYELNIDLELLKRQQQTLNQVIVDCADKRERGRPKGSKNRRRPIKEMQGVLDILDEIRDQLDPP
jgi:hypothetical protein